MDKIFQNNCKISEILPIVNISKKAYTIELHSHAVYELLYIKKGTVSLHITGKKNKLIRGGVIFILPSEKHKLVSMTNKEFEYCSFVFDKTIFGNEDNPCRIFFDSILINRFLDFPDWLLNRFYQLCSEKEIGTPGYEVMQYAFLFQVFSHIVSTKQYQLVTIIRTQTKQNISAVQVVIEYIQKNYMENLSFDELLQLTNYSKSHFCKIFKDTTGMNLTEYINKYRVERACLELQFTKKNITEIAMQTGFNNIQYFSRIFKEYMDCSPKQYQLKMKRVK